MKHFDPGTVPPHRLLHRSCKMSYKPADLYEPEFSPRRFYRIFGKGSGKCTENACFLQPWESHSSALPQLLDQDVLLWYWIPKSWRSIFSTCTPSYARQMFDSCCKRFWLISLSPADCALWLITILKLAYWEEKNWMWGQTSPCRPESKSVAKTWSTDVPTSAPSGTDTS